MSRFIPEPTYNKYQKLIDRVNDHFMAVKVSKMDMTDPKIKKAIEYHPLLTNDEIDILHRDLQEMFNEFEKPMRLYR